MDCKKCATTCEAGGLGHLGCLWRLHMGGVEWHPQTSSNIAVNGHLDCLKFAYENGCPLDDGICTDAAFNGELECMAFAHGHGAPLDASLCSAAAYFNGFDILVYAHVHGAPGVARFERLIPGFVAARKHRAATQIQRWWIDRVYKPGGSLYTRYAAAFVAAQHRSPPT